MWLIQKCQVMYCSTSGFLNVKIVKHVTKEYTAIMLGGGFFVECFIAGFFSYI